MRKDIRTHMELSIHRCIGLRVSRYYPDIANAIGIEILTEDGGVEVLMYRQPREVTDALREKFTDDDTTISHGDATRGKSVAA